MINQELLHIIKTVNRYLSGLAPDNNWIYNNLVSGLEFR